MPKFNVNFSDSTHAVLTEMSERLDVPMAEVIRESLSIYWWLIREVSSGSTLLVQRGDRAPSELVIPYLERLRRPAAGDELPGPSASERSRRGRRSMSPQGT